MNRHQALECLAGMAGSFDKVGDIVTNHPDAFSIDEKCDMDKYVDEYNEFAVKLYEMIMREEKTND